MGDNVASAFEDTFTTNSLSDSQMEQPSVDVNGMQAMIWYGTLSIVNAFFALLWYLLGSNNSVIAGYMQIMLSMQIFYWPVSMGWMAISLFDSNFTRQLYKGTITLSTLAPFAGNIIGFVYLFINADASSDWGTWYFWLLWPLFLAYDVGQMLIQFLFIPTILDFVDSEALATA